MIDRGQELLLLYTKAPRAFWRVDVDVSLDAAAKMARFAYLSGVRATFYVMLRGEFYNPFARPGRDAIAEIAGLGHALGLHVDCLADEDPEEMVIGDQDLLHDSELSQVDPLLVSFHMPPPHVLWRNFPQFENAYASRWRGRYLSDARGEFPPEKTAMVSDEMQVALHPEYWFEASDGECCTEPDSE